MCDGRRPARLLLSLEHHLEVGGHVVLHLGLGVVHDLVLIADVDNLLSVLSSRTIDVYNIEQFVLHLRHVENFKSELNLLLNLKEV